jgi:hypothetical protein
MWMRAAGWPRSCSAQPIRCGHRGLSGRAAGHIRARSDLVAGVWRGRSSARQDFAAAQANLERLTLHNPDFKSPDAQLLYARTLESQDALEEAERAYAALAPGYPGAEARLRYALLLKRRGNLPEARGC